MSTVFDLMLAIRERRTIFYHKDTNKFDSRPYSESELKMMNFDAVIPMNDPNNFRLPSYEEINHEEIMRFFVRECVDDKEKRKQLFDILRRHDFMDAYLGKLHELDLYDDFVNVCEGIYFQIFEEWADKNGLDFKK